MTLPRNLALATGAALVFASACLAAEVKTAVLRIDRDRPLPISRLDIRPDDLGFAGGQLGIEDNQTTGQFIGMDFALATRAVPPDEAGAALDALVADGNRIVILVDEEPDVAALADRAGPEVLLLNAGSRDESLRDDQCRANLLHVAPSRGMLTDAVLQFLMWKKWDEILLIHGSHPEDRLLADSYRRSAEKFGAEIVETREYVDTGGSRRTDTGYVLVQRQMPVFTQDAEDHDVVVTADEADVFAAYLPYQTWEARPVVGSAGLRPVSWHAALEAWGATQFQRRFERLANRPMREEDYQVWLALRVVGEAVTRTQSADPKVIRDYALSEAFELAAFMGQKLTFRPWNGQLRLPVLLTDGRVIASVSPQDGFLHQVSPLDTLGLDRPESRCVAFGG